MPAHRCPRAFKQDQPMQSKRMNLAGVATAASALSGCSLFKKATPTMPVLVSRVAVLASEVNVSIDPATAALPIALPGAAVNAEWAQSGGNAAKAMGHVALG